MKYIDPLNIFCLGKRGLKVKHDITCPGCFIGAQMRHVHTADKCDVGINSCLARAVLHSHIFNRPSALTFAK